MSISPRALVSLVSLLIPACAVVDPDAAPPLSPTLVLACEHPDMWFEGFYRGPDAAPGPADILAHPATHPHRPTALHTQLARADWDGPRGLAAQTACADVCVGTAGPGADRCAAPSRLARSIQSQTVSAAAGWASPRTAAAAVTAGSTPRSCAPSPASAMPNTPSSTPCSSSGARNRFLNRKHTYS